MIIMYLKNLYSFSWLLWLLVCLVESTIYFADPHMKKMIEISANDQPCKLHHDRNVIENILNSTKQRYIHGPDALNELSNACTDVEQINKTGGFIFPGTKWCGPGSIANGYNDLGVYSNEDRCCREHDHCQNVLEPGQCRHGICNISPFRRSHCDCDEAFKKCLYNANSDTANILGSIYFNVAQLTCFQERRSCPQYMRDNLSYSWLCEEWKFVPSSYFTASILKAIKEQNNMNEISNGKPKSREPSKINEDLESIFGKDDDITKIMNDFKTLRN